MIIGILIAFAFICFVVDLATRKLLERYRAEHRRREREAALAESVRLDFSSEAKSLKRVEIANPVARILCVDDEEIILDSFRKILVLDGYAVDTVQTGQEALGLIQKHHYDFVFTDLRMPAMDGVEVAKAVRHMRPDIDVVIITGYATVETAVECMRCGAMDYVQKPFSEDELRAFTKKALFKRQDQIEKRLKPKIHITHGPGHASVRPGEFSIPGGVWISPGHCWASLAQDGSVTVGLDDFARKLIGRIDAVEMPTLNATVQAGQPLFAVRQGSRRIQFHSPISGRVMQLNQSLAKLKLTPDVTPYHNHWVCMISGEKLDAEMPLLKIGNSAVALFQEDIARITAFMHDKANVGPAADGVDEALCIGALEKLDDTQWTRATRLFFGQAG